MQPSRNARIALVALAPALPVAAAAGPAGDGVTADGAIRMDAGGLKVTLDKDGVEIIDGAGRWRLWLAGGSRVAPAVTGGVVAYAHAGGVIEWYRPRGNGLEQGFTLTALPRGDVVLRTAVRGPGRVVEEDWGVRVGELRYLRPHARDGAGRPLPVELRWDASAHAIALRIPRGALLGAALPIVID